MWLLQFGKLPVGLRLTLIGPTIRPSAAWLAFGIGAVAVLAVGFSSPAVHVLLQIGKLLEIISAVNSDVKPQPQH